MKRLTTRSGILTCVLIFSTPVFAYGDGFRIPYQGTKAAGQAEAFIAQADDPSALFYNPAGLTQLRGVQIYAGSNFITGHTEYTSPSGATASSSVGKATVWPPPSHVYITANLEDLGVTSLGPLSLGIGLTSPFGTLIEWPENGPFSSVVTDATLPLIDIKPTFAYRIFDMLSIGAGVDIYTFASFLGEGQAEIKTNTGGVKSEINGTDTSLGYNVSALLTPLRNSVGKPLVNFGVVYKSGTELDLAGALLINGVKFADSEITVNLPQVVGVGIAGWPIRNQTHEWKVEYDMEWIGWSTFNNLNAHLSNGTVVPAPRNWDDTYTLSLGTEFKWLEPSSLPDWEIAARAGYQRSQAPNPDRTFEPSVPDANWNIFAVGLGLKCKEGGHFLRFIDCGSSNSSFLYPKAIVLDLGFSVAYWESRTINGNIISPTINGTYKTKDWYIGHVSIGFEY